MKERLLAVDWKDLSIRAIKTFIQTFISYCTIDGVFGISDKVGFQKWILTTGLSALAGGVSAVWNLILDVISNKAGEALDKIGDYGESFSVDEETADYESEDVE